jgi:hypothetical protein
MLMLRVQSARHWIEDEALAAVRGGQSYRLKCCQCHAAALREIERRMEERLRQRIVAAGRPA